MIKQHQINQSLQTPDSKRELNRALFSVVAKKYGLLTRVLSFGCDSAWKTALIHELPRIDAPQCLDLACGTGDLSILLSLRYPQGQVIGIDLTPAMLEIADSNNSRNNLKFIQADMACPPVLNNSVDIITGGYALRNAPDLDVLLQTVWDKLKPGGVASFLDFSKSDNTIGQRWQIRLLTLWTGFWGILLHGNPAIYNYIPASLKGFPDEKQLEEKISQLGFINYTSRSYHRGFVSQISFAKPRV